MTEEENGLLAEVGRAIASIVDSNPEGTYAYVEVREMWAAAAIYKDEGNRVVYHSPNREFGDAIEDLWYAREIGQRWGAMHYAIVEGQFSVEFDYPDQFAPDEDYDVRHQRALKARYGDKPIYYPSPEDWHELNEEDLSGE